MVGETTVQTALSAITAVAIIFWYFSTWKCIFCIVTFKIQCSDVFALFAVNAGKQQSLTGFWAAKV